MMRIGIIGTGNIGRALATGLVESGRFEPGAIFPTRRKLHLLDDLKAAGYSVLPDNREVVQQVDAVILATEPHHADEVITEIREALDPKRHTLISIVTGLSLARIKRLVDLDLPVVRAMPNTAIAVRESITCLANGAADVDAIETAREIFAAVGRTTVIDEEQMIGATALGACGIAFFLRAIRAASQGGIEIGFSAEDALAIAAQTAKGAASLLVDTENHPEHEIDRVTTPKGCTISGLNLMEYEGFSSAMIKGITISAEKASKLYDN